MPSTLNWLNLSRLAPTLPPARDSFGMTYDAADGYVLLFGGINTSGQLGDTWSYRAGIWTQLNVTGPSPRELPGMTYDAQDGYVLLFGGDCCGAYQGGRDLAYGDTWTFAHGKWTRLSPSTHPSNRTAEGLTFDGHNHSVLLFGGYSSNTFNDLSDTWKFTGGNWTMIYPTVTNSTKGPKARERLVFGYDAAYQRVVMFGGYSAQSFSTLSDTWTYASGNWNLVATASARTPSAREDAGLAYDPAAGRSIMFGGDSIYVGGNLLNDIWEFVGTNWTRVNLTTMPSARSEFGFAWDPVDYCLLLAEGSLNLGTHRAADDWSLGANLSASIRAVPPRIALGVSTSLVAKEVDNASAVSWVGYLYSGLPPGCVSANVTPLHCLPTAGGNYSINLQVVDRWGSVNAGNATLNVTVAGLIGSFVVSPSTIYLHQSSTLTVTTGGGTAPFTYSYSGVPAGCSAANAATFVCTPNGTGLPRGWTRAVFAINVTVRDASGRHGNASATLTLLQLPRWGRAIIRSGAPSPRDRFGMVFDVVDNYTLLFGGSFRNATTSVAYNDTWVYFAGSWVQIVPAVSPSPRYQFGMVYDAALKAVVLFGGTDATGTTYYGDTWLFSSGNWTKLRPATSPHPRGAESFVYDPSSGHVVLFGGWAGHDFSDTWTFSGTTWAPVATPSKLAGRQAAGFAYDALDHESVLFGGVNHTLGGLSDTWRFQNGTWSHVTGATHPPSLLFASVATLPNGTILLIGGESGTTFQSVGTTWAFGPGHWYRLNFSAAVRPPRQGAGMVWDARDGYVVLFGGSTTPKSLASTYLADTWKLTGLAP